uniref:Gcp-like domain-containing protein n=1 Tax=Romanomermis culicivorax TaxID=13658 RepID=A0A915KJ62_ROMCU
MSKNRSVFIVDRSLKRLFRSSNRLHSLKNEAGCSYATSAAAAVKPIILGIETSCDDTGVAVLNGRGEILSEIVKSQQAFSTKFGGVIPLFAASQHRANVLPAVEQCLEDANLKYEKTTTRKQKTVKMSFFVEREGSFLDKKKVKNINFGENKNF